MSTGNLFEEVEVKSYRVEFSPEILKISENLVFPIPNIKDLGKIYTQLDIESLKPQSHPFKDSKRKERKKYRNLSLFHLKV